MNEHRDLDPLEALRLADPVDAEHLPSASLARIRARVQENVMNTTLRRRLVPPKFLAAGVGLIATGILAIGLILTGGRTPQIMPGSSPGTGSAMCVEPYSLDALAHRGFAFDGTVTGIAGNQVTFAINVAYRGVTDPSVTLTAEGMTGTTITSAGGPGLTVGERYLVAGDEHFVWACGYTQPYDAGVAATWATALQA